MFFLEFVGQPASPREKSTLELWSGSPRIGENKAVAILRKCGQTPLQRHLTIRHLIKMNPRAKFIN